MLSSAAFAQDAVLEQITGDALPTPDLDRIEFYSDNPLLLDSASVNDILQLPLISRSTAQRIVAVLRAKTVASIAALCDAVGCAEEERYVLERCARLGKVTSAKIPISIRTRAMLWATPPSAATDGRFRGSPHELYTRAYSSVGATTIAALSNKDAGEPLAADFVSASVATRLGNSRIFGRLLCRMWVGIGGMAAIWRTERHRCDFSLYRIWTWISAVSFGIGISLFPWCST